MGSAVSVGSFNDGNGRSFDLLGNLAQKRAFFFAGYATENWERFRGKVHSGFHFVLARNEESWLKTSAGRGIRRIELLRTARAVREPIIDLPVRSLIFSKHHFPLGNA